MTRQKGAAADVVVIGAGAAGLATAIFTKRAAAHLTVAVLDGAKRPGAKILVSGGGRCNVTNARVTERDFWGGKRTVIRRVLSAFTVDDTMAFFAGLGVTLHEEAHGKLFPDSHRARDVLEALLGELSRLGVALTTAARVTAVERAPDGFVVRSATGEIACRSVVLATGGQSLPRTGSDGAGYAMAAGLGHTIVPPVLGLVPLVLGSGEAGHGMPATGRPIHAELSGVSHDADVAVWVERAVAIRLTGSLLWTHFGVSGPVVLDASRHWLRARQQGRDARVTIGFCPGERFERIDARLASLAGDRGKASVGTALSAIVPASVATVILDRLEIDPALPLARLARAARRRLAHALGEWPLDVTGSRGANYAEVTAGGVSLDEIDPASMESRVCPGLFVVGEILDVDGRIGGFNFQWAWATAAVAASALAAEAGHERTQKNTKNTKEHKR